LEAVLREFKDKHSRVNLNSEGAARLEYALHALQEAGLIWKDKSKQQNVDNAETQLTMVSGGAEAGEKSEEDQGSEDNEEKAGSDEDDAADEQQDGEEGEEEAPEHDMVVVVHNLPPVDAIADEEEAANNEEEEDDKQEESEEEEIKTQDAEDDGEAAAQDDDKEEAKELGKFQKEGTGSSSSSSGEKAHTENKDKDEYKPVLESGACVALDDSNSELECEGDGGKHSAFKDTGDQCALILLLWPLPPTTLL
jgi:hypothetical protein